MILLNMDVMINYLFRGGGVLVSPLSGVGVVYPVSKKVTWTGTRPSASAIVRTRACLST